MGIALQPVRREEKISEKAYRLLKEGIAEHVLTPGSYLHEAEIAAALRISRTPLREACLRLQQEGFLSVIPRRGIYIKYKSLEDFLDLLLLREILEGLAARLAARRIPDQTKLAMRRLLADFHHGDVEKSLEADTAFHGLLAEGSRHLRLIESLQNIFGHIQKLKEAAFTVPTRGDNPLHEHRLILEAIEHRNPDLAEQRAREHVRNMASALTTWRGKDPFWGNHPDGNGDRKQPRGGEHNEGTRVSPEGP